MSNDNKRLLAFFLSGLILLGWMTLMSKQKQHANKPLVPVATTTKPLPGLTAPPNGTATPKTAATGNQTAAPTATLAIAKRTTHELENNDIKINFSNLGGYLQNVELKPYHRSGKNSKQAVQLSFASAANFGTVMWDLKLNQQPFADNQLTQVIEGPQDLKFVYVNASGAMPISLVKHYHLNDQGYVLSLDVEIQNQGTEALMLNTSAAMAGELGAVTLGLFNATDPLEIAALVNDKRVHSPKPKPEPEP
jgi:YidC/Oxa1 family membrane protein insertase